MFNQLQVFLRNIHITTILSSFLFIIFIHKDFLENISILEESDFLKNSKIYVNSCMKNGSTYFVDEEACYGQVDCIGKLCNTMTSKVGLLGHVSISSFEPIGECGRSYVEIPYNISVVLSLAYISTILMFIMFIFNHFAKGTYNEKRAESIKIILYTIFKFVPIITWSYITSFAILNESTLEQHQTQSIMNIQRSKETLILVFYILEAFFCGIMYLVSPQISNTLFSEYRNNVKQ
jgi:hypothetical protein